MSNPILGPNGLVKRPSNQDLQNPKANSLEQRLEGLDLKGPQPTPQSQEPRTTKLSARDILQGLSSKRLEITQIEFVGDTSIAKGGHGDVMIADLVQKDGRPLGRKVAVKKLQVSDRMIDEDKTLRGFVNELRVVDGLSHLNIVKIIGFVEDIKKRIAWLVFPWEANGNVREFLLSGTWELPERVSLIKDVASGLEYLHTRQPPICHGDLKSLNILVNSDHRAVITDFGSSRVLRKARELGAEPATNQTVSEDRGRAKYDQHPEVTLSASGTELTLTGPSWSFRWAAPEVLNDEQPILASDIWALGWIAWEIIMDNYPFPEVNTRQHITIKVITGSLPSIYKDGQLSQIHHLCHVMVMCWKLEPKERPSAAECRGSLTWIPSVIPMARGPDHTKLRSSDLLIQTGQIHRLQNRNEEALKMFEEGLAIARSAGDKPAAAKALYCSGCAYLTQSNYTKGEECLTQALEIYVSTGDERGRVDALGILGSIHRERSEYTKAEEYYNQALVISKRIDDELGQATSLHGLGKVHRVWARYAEAKECLNQALAIFTSLKDDLRRASSLHDLGMVYQAQESYNEADDAYRQALTIGRSIGNALGQANALLWLGTVRGLQSNYSEAEELCRHALDIYKRVGNGLGRANASLELGQILRHQDRHPEAKSLIFEAAEISDRLNYSFGKRRSKQLLAQVLAEEKSSTASSSPSPGPLPTRNTTEIPTAPPTLSSTSSSDKYVSP